MKHGKVVSLGEFKTRPAPGDSKTEKVLSVQIPELNALWELLDKNISLSVWQKRT